MSEHKPNYRKATNTAYEILAHSHSTVLPIDLNSIINQYTNSLLVKTYGQMAQAFGWSRSYFLESAPSEYGFTLMRGKRRIIAYNDYKDDSVNRFTISHELGHYILQHQEETPAAEKEANCFSRNLLCPVPMILALNLKSPYQYDEYFGISKKMYENCILNRYYDTRNINKKYYKEIYFHYSEEIDMDYLDSIG